MQNAIINLILASVSIFSAFIIGNEVKKAASSDFTASALLACRAIYFGGLILGAMGIIKIFG